MKFIPKKEPRIPVTQEGYEKLIEEKNVLQSRRPEAVDHLREARNMGDLSENGYYKASRQQLSFLDSRIRRVERLIRLAKIIEPTRVKLTDGTREYEYTIVGGFESDPAKKYISPASPLGRALIGKKSGDAVEVHTPSGIKTYTILSIG